MLRGGGDVVIEMFRLILYRELFCFILIFNSVLGKVCKTDLQSAPCPHTQYCDEKLLICQCLPGYKIHNDTYCIQVANNNSPTTKPNTSSLVDENHHGGSVVAGILIPLFLILFVICGVYFSRKYQLYSWVRRRINQRNRSYDEFMIGQDAEDDDPPLR